MGKPITEIKKELEECALQELPSRMQQYEQDERKGVQNLLARCVRRLEEEEKEQQRQKRCAHPILGRYRGHYRDFPCERRLAGRAYPSGS